MRSGIRKPLLIPAILLLASAATQVLAARLAGPADSPSPKFQIDLQNTGRSEYEIVADTPALLWAEEVDPCPGPGLSEISLDSTGRLIFVSSNCLVAFDPANREIDWSIPFGSFGTPLVDQDDTIYLGSANTFFAIDSQGEILWSADLGGPLITGFGSATIGPGGDIYFNHNGLWSFTADGVFNWVHDAGEITRSNPAMDSAGNLYDSVPKFKSFEPDGSLRWSTSFPNPLWSLSIGPDGTVYAPGCEGKLYALDPVDGSINWQFTSPNPPEDCPDMLGPSIAPDGTLVFAYEGYGEVFAVSPDGELNWVFDDNEGYIYEAVKIDSAGNIFFCATNSRCIALNLNGQIIWEYVFPQTIYETDVRSMTSIVLASDEVFYLLDSEDQIEVFTYPSLIPHLTTETETLAFTSESWDPTPLSAEIELTSTVTPIDWTASVTNTNWIDLSSDQGTTPETLTITVHPGALPPGEYHDVLRIIPQDIVTTWLDPVTIIETDDMKEDWIEIPIRLNVGTDFAYLPVITPHYEYVLYYFSLWPTAGYLNSVDERGNNLVRRAGYPSEGLPDWSPDGERVVFPETVDGERELYVMDHDGTNKQQITFTEEEEYGPLWSPDGQWILYTAGAPNQFRQIFKIRPDGSEKTLVSSQAIFDMAYWSPNGSMIAATDRFTTWVMNADGSGFKVVADDHFSDQVVGWSPDGSYLLLEVHIFSGTGGEIALIKPDGSGFINLTQSSGIHDSQPRWSPDGSRIVFVSYPDSDGNSEIFVMNADGSGITRLTENDAIDRNPQWSPDSTRISHETDRNGKFEVFVADLLGNVLFYINSYAQGEYNLSWELSR